MLEIGNVQLVLLDHSYCKKVSLDLEFSSVSKNELIKMADDMLDWKDSIGIEFDPPSVDSDAVQFAHSPSHSVDSGFDNELNLLSNIDSLDLDMLLNTEFNSASSPKRDSLETNVPVRTSKSSATATNSASDISEVERSKKNALAARENRLKKKRYLEGVEKELGELRRENEILKAKDRRHNQVVEKLEQEVSYLKNVLANQSTLSVLVQRLVSTPGISFNLASPGEPSTYNPTNSKNDDDDATGADYANDDDNQRPKATSAVKGKVKQYVQARYQTRGTKRSTTTEPSHSESKKTRQDVNGGVCLHVGQDMVSLTFCSQCSSNVSGNSGK